MMQIFTLNPSKFWKLNKGFSLIELLISVVLLGLVMAIIYGGFFQIANFSSAVKSNLNSREQLRLLMKIVLDDLQNVKYLNNFSESKLNNISLKETGLIADFGGYLGLLLGASIMSMYDILTKMSIKLKKRFRLQGRDPLQKYQI